MLVGDLKVARCGNGDIHMVIPDAILVIVDTAIGPFLVTFIVVTVRAEDSAQIDFGGEMALAGFPVGMIVPAPACRNDHPLGRHGGDEFGRARFSRSVMGCNQNDESREFAEAALAHAVGGVEAACMRSDLFERPRRLIQAGRITCSVQGRLTRKETVVDGGEPTG